ncbi:hypothetical protein [Yoonia sp. 208BN28-4]|uniref:hypothetical protein n=1 Tax=Yoonia sp. 208BN28-4 TaxID=3126505 RepID=UPI0030B5F0A8
MTKSTPALTLTKTRLHAGVWEGVLSGGGKTEPVLTVRHQDTIVPGIALTPSDTDGTWVVQVPVPTELVADGVQTFVILHEDSGETLASFALLAGDGLAEDIRAEVSLLRAELDMLKRAFRRHSADAAQD